MAILRQKIHTVFFDAGGTLVQSPGFFDYIAERVAGERAFEIEPALKDQFTAMLRDESLPFVPIKAILASVVKTVCREFGLPDQGDRVATYYRELFTMKASLYDDVIPCLDRLKALGKTLHMISDADADVLIEELNRFGVRKYFTKLVISSEVQGYKPSEPMVTAASALCREPRSRIILIGDDAVDIRTAKRIGIKAVTVRCPDGLALGADFALNSLAELFDLIE